MNAILKAYKAAKKTHPEALLLFQTGDFYELFEDDAKTAAKLLGLTLTSRYKHSERPVPMTGFPLHQMPAYVEKLQVSGFKVVVLEESKK